MTGAVSVIGSTASFQEVRRGSNPTTALQSIRVQPISFKVAKKIIVKNHYLHSLPGGTMFCFGAFLEGRLLGAITFGSGPANAFKMVTGVPQQECLTLTRLWLSDELPKNSESRIISISIRAIKKNTKVKFLLSYSDPSQGHLGGIYQATGWLYTGLSEAMPMFDLGDGRTRHSRSLSHAFGSQSLKHFQSCGINVKVIEQPRKHRYIYFLDKSYQDRLTVQVKPYPKKDGWVQGNGSQVKCISPLIYPYVLQERVNR
jgi:hypothetical protein